VTSVLLSIKEGETFYLKKHKLQQYFQIENRVIPDKEEPMASVLDNFYYHLIALSAAFAHCK
jgi:hypothetical protein